MFTDSNHGDPPSCGCCQRGWGWHPQCAQSSSLSGQGLWVLTGSLIQESWSYFLLKPGIWCGGQWCPAPCIAGLHPGQPTWQHMARIHLCQPFNSTSYTTDGFLARKISDMDKSVTEACKGVAHTKYIFSFSHLRAKADDLLFLLFFPLARCYFCMSSPHSTTRKRACLIFLSGLLLLLFSH